MLKWHYVEHGSDFIQTDTFVEYREFFFPVVQAKNGGETYSYNSLNQPRADFFLKKKVHYNSF